ncbi:MAG: WD40 repeat domain-containing protein [Planctomycetota bacterium]
MRTFYSELENIHHASFSPDGQRLLIAGGVAGESGTAELFNWPEGDVLSRWDLHNDVIYEANWSPNGQSFVTASADGFCKLIDPATGQVRSQFSGHSGVVITAIFLDADDCVSGGVDQTIRVWKAADGRLLRTLNNHTHQVNGVAIQPKNTGSPTDLLASISEDRTVRFWQPRTGRLVRFTQLTATPRALVWSSGHSDVFVATADGAVSRVYASSANVSGEPASGSGQTHEILLDEKRRLILLAGDFGVRPQSISE